MTSPAWFGALAATLTAQTAASFLSRLIPTLAPVLILEAGFTPTFIGALTANVAFGSMLFLLAGYPLVRRAGPVRALQLGLLLGIAGTGLLAAPSWLGAILASLLIGLGYGPSTPAGSEILQHHAPARHRTLVFSIKQAGVPLGGVAAGLLLPPLAVAADWRWTIVVSIALVLIATA